MAQGIAARLEIRLHPQAKKSRVTGMLGKAYKIDIIAPAVQGKANDACVEFLANLVGISRSQVRLVKGQTNRSKVFEFTGIEMHELRRKLNQAL